VAAPQSGVVAPLKLPEVVTTLAGMAGQIGGQDGTGEQVRFFHPSGAAVAADSTLYVQDSCS
jgi:hypothetical protein